jgi:hypothetical protein
MQVRAINRAIAGNPPRALGRLSTIFIITAQKNLRRLTGLWTIRRILPHPHRGSRSKLNCRMD